MSLRNYYMQQMGIETWTTRERKPTIEPLSLEKLALTVAACTRCPLHATRTQTVFARGNPEAALMIVGEAPGFHEDQQGLPFVGKAGALLDQMLYSINLNKNDVYIANVIKCRPPNNRDPQVEEIAQCGHYLAAQIQLVNPKILLAVGRFAAQYLSNSTLPLNKIRNQPHYYQEIPVVASFHPAYLLRNPIDKKKAYEDWLMVKQLLGDTIMYAAYE